MLVTHHENILDIGGRKVPLIATIQETLLIQGLTIVLVDDGRIHGKGDKSMNRNVLAFDNDANQVWVIQEAPHGDEDWPKPYTKIAMRDDGLVARTWIGVEYLVNLMNGNVTATRSDGRPW